MKGVGSEEEKVGEFGQASSVYFSLAVAMGRYQMPEALLQVCRFV